MAGRKSSRKVVATRKGRDRVYPLTEGGGAWTPQDIPTKWVTAANGDRYEIPVDPETGTVPIQYIFARLLEEDSGSRKGGRRNAQIDLMKDADRLFKTPPSGWTPEYLVKIGWWQHPNETDLVGIDDATSDYTQQLMDVAKSAQGAGKQIVMIMPEASAARARAILARDFTATELKKAVKKGGVIIMEGQTSHRSAAGQYSPVYENASVKTPVIVLRPGWDEETLVHEFGHHLRHVDASRSGLTRTPFKQNSKGENRPTWDYGPGEFNSARNLEEAATVAESYVRAKEVKAATGYYTRTGSHGADPHQRSRYDRKLMVPKGSKPQKGRKAENTVKKRFDDASISDLSYYRPGRNAKAYYRELDEKGALKKAEKPKSKKKTKEDAATRGATASPGTGTALANRKHR